MNATHPEFRATPLMICCRIGNIAAVKHLLSNRNIDTKKRDIQGYTALTWAASKGAADIITLLLKKDPALLEMKTELGSTPMMFAAQGGHLKAVEVLLAHGARVNAKNNHGWTALLFACTQAPEWGSNTKRTEIVRLLIEKGAVLEAADTLGEIAPKGTRALMLASAAGFEDIVSLLISRGACIKAEDADHNTALSWARRNNHLGIVALFVKTPEQHQNAAALSLMDLNPVSPALTNTQESHNHTTPIASLHHAAIHGDMAMLNLCLNRGDNINSRTNGGWTPLLCAANEGHAAIVEELLKKGADATLTTEQGKNVIDVAKKHMIPLLMSKLSSFTPKKSRNTADENPKTPKRQRRLQLDERLDDRSGESESPISQESAEAPDNGIDAAMSPNDFLASDNQEQQREPIEASPENIYIRTTPEYAPEVHRAPIETYAQVLAVDGDQSGNEQVLALEMQSLQASEIQVQHSQQRLRALLEQAQKTPTGALALIKKYVDRLLFDACAVGDLQQIKELIELKADIHGKNDAGLTVLHAAIVTGKKDIVELLLHNGSSVDAADGQGNTPLMLAAFMHKKDLVETLLIRGADPLKQNREGRTALIEAAAKASPEKAAIIELLLNDPRALEITDNSGKNFIEHLSPQDMKDLMRILMPYVLKGKRQLQG